MRKELKQIVISNFKTESGKKYSKIPLSYQVFGQKLGSAPIILVNHTFTGNSQIIGKNGWWDKIVGEKKAIDLKKYTVLAFNIPGNGFDYFLIDRYKDFTLKDISKIFLIGLKELKIDKLFANVGGSIGGNLIWELLFKINIENCICIASDWRASNWLIANLKVQEILLETSNSSMFNARIHAMNMYRNPESYKQKFSIDKKHSELNAWFDYHGKQLDGRFHLKAHKFLNHLLMTTFVFETEKEFLNQIQKVKGNIHIVGINSDLLFPAKDGFENYEKIKNVKKNTFYHEIDSIHGHAAFLIEDKQVSRILKDILKVKK
ncbi:alpha/beta fold hydrolase [Aureivirga marina]|uniref:alpha/beta fold hydrolase n=1 Tax=Aureivirga marina TaxID=1182451 RepID=UPI0018C9DA2B|nr:alpha/beta fold hydrolase [Aureivirga marina]